MEFQRSRIRQDTYHVIANGLNLGHVQKHEGWTVRGKPITWKAYRGHVYLGSAKTRKEAAQLLAK